MPKKSRIGTFLRVPLADGSFGYGRILSDPYVSFYALRTTTASSDLDAIEKSPILFTQAVRFTNAQWETLGVRALSGGVAAPVVRFMQDLANPRKCVIYDSEGRERDATPEECIGLERAAVWDAHHIEGRLLDAFMGRPNQAELRARVRLA